MKRTPIGKVRCFHYDPNFGLFLIRTKKSEIVERNWTTPGGEIKSGENNIDSIVRWVDTETGFKLRDIDPNPFKIHKYPERGKWNDSEGVNREVTVYSYWVDINIPDIKNSERVTRVGNPYTFLVKPSKYSAKEQGLNLTQVTKRVIDSIEFKKGIRGL